LPAPVGRSGGRVRAAIVLSWLVALSWAPPASAQWRLTSCTTLGQNLFVHDVMVDLYLWNQAVPPVNPGRYRSPEAYLEAVRYRALDSTFSYIGNRAEDEAFYSASQFIGLGLSTRTTGAGMRVLQVFAGGPAAEAGLKRGDRIVAIDGRSVEELAAAGLLATAFGPNDAGYTVSVAFRSGDGPVVEATLVKRVVTIPTVSDTQIHDVEGRKVGYLFFRNFVEPSFAALDDAFAQFRAEGIDDLVLDLRYNGGGLVSVAGHLAGLIGGKRTEGRVFTEFFHNPENSYRNVTATFGRPAQALTLDRLIVITTRSSASASELVINGLRPFMPVIVIGEATYGKPVGQYGIQFCDKVLYPVAFSLRNADGEGAYFAGLPATCPAADGLDHPLGDRAEASLAEALTFVRTGACSPRALVSGRARAGEAEDAPRETGFRALLNAW
jgi:C-terminal peptidase prc